MSNRVGGPPPREPNEGCFGLTFGVMALVIGVVITVCSL